MAARMSAQNRKRLLEQGMGEMEVSWALNAMSHAAVGDQAQVTAMSVDWSLYSQKTSSKFNAGPSLFRDLAGPLPRKPTTSRREEINLAQNLASLPKDEIPSFLLNEVGNLVSDLLGLTSNQKIKPSERLFEAGLDSLMAVELRNLLQSSLNLTLPATIIFDFPTVQALTDFILEELDDQIDSDPRSEQTMKPRMASTVDELDSQSDDELASLLDAELENVDQYLED